MSGRNPGLPRRGARHEAAELNGLAHFLEHMAFKGAQGLGARQLAGVERSVAAAAHDDEVVDRDRLRARRW